MRFTWLLCGILAVLSFVLSGCGGGQQDDPTLTGSLYGNVSVKVGSNAPVPVKRAYVTLMGQDMFPYTLYTDNNGNYFFKHMHPAQYSVVIDLTRAEGLPSVASPVVESPLQIMINGVVPSTSAPIISIPQTATFVGTYPTGSIRMDTIRVLPPTIINGIKTSIMTQADVQFTVDSQ